MFGVGTKLKESIFKSNNQINSTVTTRTWVLSKEWIITWPNTRLAYEWKNDGGTRLFEWYMLFFRVRGYYIVLTKIKAMSLCLFWLFEEMLSMQFFWNIQRRVKYPIRRWWHKTLLDEIWTQAYSEPLQASKMECFCANS